MSRGSDTGRFPPGDGHFWLSGTAAVLLTLAVVAAVLGLHDWSTQSERSAQSIGALRTAIAVEQEGALDSPRLTASRQRQADAALMLVEATETSTAQRSVIVGMTGLYQLAVSYEISALLGGNVLAAGTMNVALGDPAFTALDGKLATISQAEASTAARGVTAAFVASIGIVIGSGVVILLYAEVARRRRAAIAAQVATSAALASEARVTSTREETFRSLFDENPQAMLVTRLPARHHRGRQPDLSCRQQCRDCDVRIQPCRVSRTHARGDTPHRGSRASAHQPACDAGRTHAFRRHSARNQEWRRARRRDRHTRNDLRRRACDDHLLERCHRPCSPAARARAPGISRCADRAAESFALRRSS